MTMMHITANAKIKRDARINLFLLRLCIGVKKGGFQSEEIFNFLLQAALLKAVANKQWKRKTATGHWPGRACEETSRRGS